MRLGPFKADSPRPLLASEPYDDKKGGTARGATKRKEAGGRQRKDKGATRRWETRKGKGAVEETDRAHKEDGEAGTLWTTSRRRVGRPERGAADRGGAGAPGARDAAGGRRGAASLVGTGTGPVSEVHFRAYPWKGRARDPALGSAPLERLRLGARGGASVPRSATRAHAAFLTRKELEQREADARWAADEVAKAADWSASPVGSGAAATTASKRLSRAEALAWLKAKDDEELKRKLSAAVEAARMPWDGADGGSVW